MWMSCDLRSLNNHCGAALEWDIEPPAAAAAVQGCDCVCLKVSECAAGSCCERARLFLSKQRFKKAIWHIHNPRWLSILLFLCDILTSCHRRLWLLSQPQLTNTHSVQTLVIFSISMLKLDCRTALSFSVSWALPFGPEQGNAAISNLCSHQWKFLYFMLLCVCVCVCVCVFVPCLSKNSFWEALQKRWEGEMGER